MLLNLVFKGHTDRFLFGEEFNFSASEIDYTTLFYCLQQSARLVQLIRSLAAKQVRSWIELCAAFFRHCILGHDRLASPNEQRFIMFHEE